MIFIFIMITAYHWIASDNIDLPIDITLDFSQGMPDVEKEQRFKYYNALSKGIKWYTAEKEYTAYEEGQRIYGIMTPDFKKMVVVYPYDHPEFNSPGNAVIFDEDKGIYKRLSLPQPISDLSKGRGGYVNDRAFEGLYFGGVRWVRDEHGEIGMAVALVFDREYCEMRTLNYITGEIGACLGAYRL